MPRHNRDPEIIGATGALAAKIRAGTATIGDYIQTPRRELMLNPLVAMLASVSDHQNITNSDLKIATTRLLALEMIVALADRMAESMKLWWVHRRSNHGRVGMGLKGG